MDTMKLCSRWATLWAMAGLAVMMTGCGATNLAPLAPLAEDTAIGRGQQTPGPKHLQDANLVVDTLLAQRNQTPTVDKNDYTTTNAAIVWKGENNALLMENRTVCAPFVTRVLTHAYGLTKSFWQTNFYGSDSPDPWKYYDRIVAGGAGNPLTQITDTRTVTPGDLIAIKYDPDFAENQNTGTGHMMIVAGNAAVTDAPDSVDPTDTLEYRDYLVVDSSRSKHGNDDTRILKPGEADNDGNNDGLDNGAGRGTFRLLVKKSDGTIVAHAWSTAPNSPLFTQTPDAQGKVSRRIALAHFTPPAL